MSDGAAEQTERAKLEERLRAAREKRERLEAELDKDADLRRMREEVEQAEFEVELQQALGEAVSQHGPVDRKIKVVGAVCHDGMRIGAAIVKRPSDLAFKRFLSETEAKKDSAMNHLWRTCLVWPDKAEVGHWIEELPWFETRLADACCELAGVGAQEVAGK